MPLKNTGHLQRQPARPRVILFPDRAGRRWPWLSKDGGAPCLWTPLLFPSSRKLFLSSLHQAFFVKFIPRSFIFLVAVTHGVVSPFLPRKWWLVVWRLLVSAESRPTPPDRGPLFLPGFWLTFPGFPRELSYLQALVVLLPFPAMSPRWLLVVMSSHSRARGCGGEWPCRSGCHRITRLFPVLLRI